MSCLWAGRGEDLAQSTPTRGFSAASVAWASTRPPLRTTHSPCSSRMTKRRCTTTGVYTGGEHNSGRGGGTAGGGCNFSLVILDGRHSLAVRLSPIFLKGGFSQMAGIWDSSPHQDSPSPPSLGPTATPRSGAFLSQSTTTTACWRLTHTTHTPCTTGVDKYGWIILSPQCNLS